MSIIRGDNELTERDYFEGRVERRLYISKQFIDNFSTNKTKKRFAYKIHNCETQYKFMKKKNEVILAENNGSGGKYQFKAILLEDNKRIESLVVQTFTEFTGNPHNAAFSFKGFEIENLYKFLKGIKELDFNTTESFKVDDEKLEEILISQEQASKIVSGNQDVIIEALKNNITKSDIVALGYRKKQLEKFEKLLEDEEYFENEINMTEAKGREAVWQNFFERNTWIFGYGLNFVFNSPLEDKKLEQVVSGYNFNNSGKRIDALMKTKGVINSFCFGEIKTHKTDLLKRVKDSYRGECWAISDELAGAIAQTQKTVQKSIKDLSTKIEIKDKRGDLTGEEVYIYQPKSFVVIGNLNEFKSEYGINEDKYSSFELFRQNNINPEIITFDELLERAKFIVKNSENEK
jgi:predicted transcriptional regulator